jgi:hypothetical protein
MSAIGLAALLIGGAVWLVLVLPGRALRGDKAELGTMSQQWRLEQRASDSERWRQS